MAFTKIMENSLEKITPKTKPLIKEITPSKSVSTKNNKETAYECAKREFLEESSINVEIALFENYFEQINIDKDVGIWLVNASNIDNLEQYFVEDTLKNNYLSWENSKVKFFSLNNLPRIKNKQITLLKDIKDFLKSKNLHH